MLNAHSKNEHSTYDLSIIITETIIYFFFLSDTGFGPS